MIINVQFTSLVEKDLDQIANGKINWQSVVQKVYSSFRDTLEIQKEILNKSSRDSSKSEYRELGKYNDEIVILKNGKYGPYVTIGERNVGLSGFLKNNPIEFHEITLDKIEDIIPYPIYLGKYRNYDIMIHMGPYGKYMKYRNKNIRIPQQSEYTLEECIRILSYSK